MSRPSRLCAALRGPVISLVLLALPLLVLPTAPAARTASISGTLTAPDGAPLSGIQVALYPHAGEPWRPVTSTRTDRAGRYRLTGLAASPTYRLGFKDAAGNYVEEYFKDAATIRTSTEVPVTDGATVSGIDAELALAGHVRGTVTGIDGAALQDVYVDAFQRLDGVPQWNPVTATVADATGGYELDGLTAGRCRIEFVYDHVAMPGPDLHYLPEYYDNGASITTATDVSVRAGATTSLKDVELAKAGGVARAGATTSGMDADLGSTATPSPTPAPSPAATPPATPAPSRLPVAGLVGTLLAATIGVMAIIAVRRRKREAPTQ